MKKENLLHSKSYAFAIRVVNLSQYLNNEKKEYVLSRQILRSGTSIGALISESEFAQSHADFINKLNIGLKEANETKYWINLLYDTKFITQAMFESLIEDIKEIIRLLVSSLKRLKNKTVV
ncbi:MAG: four helix bundle protein [Campylobacterales bacterium]|jgi:four helix bundle protein|uniref:four helix bundle protein n=1 Tax=Sulfurovum sp. TaxID=1969726 RepID=UPI00175789A5|nr:four helix bundle protein [Sulfurovum sp.]MBN2250401.1 four helix bundle protein [Campylobacterales bacterium]MDY0403862.1 four helix bundle protein [Sulfurovum sp.]HEO99236.1 four helix bundle protein [Campylobacterota bacterium]